MARRRVCGGEQDLFSAAMQGSGNGADSKEDKRPLIDSELVESTKGWLDGRALTLGNLLASERAVEYVAMLRAFVEFRAAHEPEPLHEDLEIKVCGESAAYGAADVFKSGLRQLKEWGLVTERIEKERIRGYRDKRRTKFRYRLCDDAVAFVEWLDEMRKGGEVSGGVDLTGNLLDMQRSLLAELRRMVHRVDREAVKEDLAGDVIYRVGRISEYVEATARTLQELNLRLLGFGAADFSADEAKSVVEELALFLERFGRRFEAMREEILRDVLELTRKTHEGRWRACVEKLESEGAKFRHLARLRLPDPAATLADAHDFYGAGGKLVNLVTRVFDSARRVWGKLNAKLRELERRNHRLEDLGARLAELAGMDEETVPWGWMRGLLETAAMRGDPQIEPHGEKSVMKLPRMTEKAKAKRAPEWIVPRKVGEKANVASIAQVRAKRLKEWMRARGIAPEGGRKVRMSEGAYCEFGDFRGWWN